MKSTSILGESFSMFRSLIKERWMVYVWYVLSRALEILLVGGLLGLAFVAGMFDVVDRGSFVIPMLLFVGTMVGAFLLESFFTFCLYRSLEAKKADTSLMAYLNRGTESYWPRLGKYILFSLLVAAFSFLGSFVLEITSRMGALNAFLSLVYVGLMAYLAIPAFMTFMEVIVSEQWPWATFLKTREKLQGYWWRSVGTILVWGLLTLLIYLVLGLLVGLLIFSGAWSVVQSLQSAQIDTPMELMQGMSQFFSSGMIFSVLISILLFISASILPVYGFFCVYKSIKKIAK